MGYIKKLGVLFCLLISSLSITRVYAEESSYLYSDTATDTTGTVTLKVEWNEPVAGQELMIHASASGGSGKYKFSMDAPYYMYESYSECVADPTRWKDTTYTSECESHDYSFPIVASGKYYINVHVMDLEAGVSYLRTKTFITVSDPNYPNINSIINNVVSECKTDSEYLTMKLEM